MTPVRKAVGECCVIVQFRRRLAIFERPRKIL